jgi:hypothetical protein
MWQTGVLEIGECQWLPGDGRSHWDFSIEVKMASNDEADIPCPLMGLIGRRMNPLTD